MKSLAIGSAWNPNEFPGDTEISLAEAAKILHVTRVHARRLVRDGKLSATRRNNGFVLALADVLRFRHGRGGKGGAS